MQIDAKQDEVERAGHGPASSQNESRSHRHVEKVIMRILTKQHTSTKVRTVEDADFENEDPLADKDDVH